MAYIFWHSILAFCLRHSILAFYLASILTCRISYLASFLVSRLKFLLAFFLIFYLASIPAFWHLVWHSIWHSILAFILACIPAVFLAFYLTFCSGIYFDILSDMGTEIWRSRLRSGSAHWDLELAVEDNEEEKATLIKSKKPHWQGGNKFLQFSACCSRSAIASIIRSFPFYGQLGMS